MEDGERLKLLRDLMMALQTIETVLVVFAALVSGAVLGTWCNRKDAVALLVGVGVIPARIPVPEVRKVLDDLRAEFVASGEPSSAQALEMLYARAIWISARQKIVIVLALQLAVLACIWISSRNEADPPPASDPPESRSPEGEPECS